jgi:hypothetical protein
MRCKPTDPAKIPVNDHLIGTKRDDKVLSLIIHTNPNEPTCGVANMFTPLKYHNSCT